MINSLRFTPAWVRDLDMVFGCWLVLSVFLIGQCIVHDVFIDQSSARLLADLFWYVQNWGIWLLITPLLYGFYYQRAYAGAISIKQFAPGALLFYAVSVTLEFLIQNLLNPNLNPVTYALYFVPRYGLAILVFTLVWLWRNKTLVAKCWQVQRLSTTTDTALATPAPAHAPTNPASIMAFKGRDKAPILLKDIEAVVAARNYLDIYCPQGEYIVRDTMKNMEVLLAGQDFVRTHRSALVRLSAVRRFKRLASGNGLAILGNSTEIPVNKSFMSALGKGDVHIDTNPSSSRDNF